MGSKKGSPRSVSYYCRVRQAKREAIKETLKVIAVSFAFVAIVILISVELSQGTRAAEPSDTQVQTVEQQTPPMSVEEAEAYEVSQLNIMVLAVVSGDEQQGREAAHKRNATIEGYNLTANKITYDELKDAAQRIEVLLSGSEDVVTAESANKAATTLR